jgi:hypothetical protein
MIHYGNASPSIGLIVAFPLMILIILAFIGLGIWFKKHKWGRFDEGMGIYGPWICWGLALFFVLGTAYVMFPYKAEYHQWQDVSGTVSSTNSRFLAASDGKSTEQKFVLTFEGSDQQFGCNDTRCATLREGDWAKIACKRTFQFFSTPGYDCRFRDYKAKTS